MVLKTVSMLIKINFTYLKIIFVLAHTVPFSIPTLITTERQEGFCLTYCLEDLDLFEDGATRTCWAATKERPLEPSSFTCDTSLRQKCRKVASLNQQAASMIDARLVLLAQANDEAHARTSCALQLLAPCDEPTLETAAFITVLIHLEMVGQEISVILLDRNDTKRRRLAGDLKNLVRSL